MNRDNESVPIRDVAKIQNNDNRPVWFIYSGMGSQWAGMAQVQWLFSQYSWQFANFQELMRIDRFRESIVDCTEAVRPLGCDPMALIMDGNEKIWDNTMNCMVCITAVQVRPQLVHLRDPHRLRSPTSCARSASNPTASSVTRPARCARRTRTDA